MSKHYKFFSHQQCEYYPCHNTKQELNCLFCFCPLYVLKDCGGNYTMIDDIKDCSNCLLPHRKENYEYVISKYNELKEIMKNIDNINK